MRKIFAATLAALIPTAGMAEQNVGQNPCGKQVVGSVQNLSHFRSCDGGSMGLKFHLV